MSEVFRIVNSGSSGGGTAGVADVLYNSSTNAVTVKYTDGTADKTMTLNNGGG